MTLKASDTEDLASGCQFAVFAIVAISAVLKLYSMGARRSWAGRVELAWTTPPWHAVCCSSPDSDSSVGT